MNGYAAAIVAATIQGVKMLVEARAPLAIAAIPRVIESAPYALTSAGLGDLIYDGRNFGRCWRGHECRSGSEQSQSAKSSRVA